VADRRGDTPLHAASAPQPNRTGDECRGIIRLLVTRGADVDARNTYGLTPLHRASMAGHVPVVQALVDAGARIDLRGPDGWTALHVAAASGHAPVVRELLARGAHGGARDASGRTPLAVVLDRLAQAAPATAGAAPSPLAEVRDVLEAHARP
jgi:ankyrin repeat protein